MDERIFKSKYYYLFIESLVILFTFIVVVFAHSYDFLTLDLAGYLLTFIFFIQILLNYFVFKTFLHPLSFFSIILFLFSAGQVLLYTFNQPLGDFNVYMRLDYDTLLYAIIFVVFGYLFFGLGSIFSLKRIPQKKSFVSFTAYRNERIYKVGLLLFIIGLLPFLYNLFYQVIFIGSYGYSAYYQDSSVRLNNIFTGLSYFTYTGLFFMISSSGKTIRKLCIVFLIVVSGITLLAGDRGTAFVTILSTYFLYVYFMKNGEINYLFTVLLFIGLVILVPVVAVFRHSATSSVEINYLDLIINENPIVSTLQNLGGTIWPLGKIMELFPRNFNFLLGGSYFSTLIYVIPGFLRIGPLANLGQVYLSPANWLMNTLGMSYGPGFTPFAEAYLNFGWYGTLFMFIFGFFSGKIFMSDWKAFKFDKEFVMLISILNFQLFALTARSSINNLLSFFLRYVLLPILILVIYRQYQNRRRYCNEG